MFPARRSMSMAGGISVLDLHQDRVRRARKESSGHVLTVFRKSADGIWQLARDANLVAGAGNPDRV